MAALKIYIECTFLPVESQTLQLYNQVNHKSYNCTPPPNLHIYKRKLKIEYFLSLVAYKNLLGQKIKSLHKELLYRVRPGSTIFTT